MLKKEVCLICIQHNNIAELSFNDFWNRYAKCYCPVNSGMIDIKAEAPKNCETLKRCSRYGASMLKKRICLMCMKHFYGKHLTPRILKEWHRYWDQDGICYCPTFTKGQFKIFVAKGPPEHCYFILEQTV